MKKNIKFKIKNFQKGLSLIEIVVVMGLFAILGILSTRAVLLSLSGGKKGDSLVKVRDNIDYAVSVIERQLRNSQAVNPCPLTDPNIVSYQDSLGNLSTFSCVNTGAMGYVASGSGRLTSSEVAVTSCAFSCTQGTASSTPQIGIEITAQDANAASGLTGSSISVSTKIDLRTY